MFCVHVRSAVLLPTPKKMSCSSINPSVSRSMSGSAVLKGLRIPHLGKTVKKTKNDDFDFYLLPVIKKEKCLEVSYMDTSIFRRARLGTFKDYE